MTLDGGTSDPVHRYLQHRTSFFFDVTLTSELLKSRFSSPPTGGQSQRTMSTARFCPSRTRRWPRPRARARARAPLTRMQSPRAGEKAASGNPKQRSAWGMSRVCRRVWMSLRGTGTNLRRRGPFLGRRSESVIVGGGVYPTSATLARKSSLRLTSRKMEVGVGRRDKTIKGGRQRKSIPSLWRQENETTQRCTGALTSIISHSCIVSTQYTTCTIFHSYSISLINSPVKTQTRSQIILS